MSIRIELGCPAQHRRQAASIYYSALSQKLAPALGKADRAVPFIAECINPHHCLLAFSGEELVGILGFQDCEAGLLDIGIQHLIRRYGALKGLYALLLLAILDSQVDADTLYLDGVAVSEGCRGQGVGAKLIARFEALARERDKKQSTLDVIGDNSQAIRLYQRLGYSTHSVEQVLFLKPIFGFEQVFHMAKPLVKNTLAPR